MPRQDTLRPHLASRIAGCLAVVAALAGCGIVPTGSADPAPRPPTKVDRARAYLEEVAAMPALDLADTTRPAAPKGYDDRDVDQLVREATDVLERSIDPGLSAMTPDQAVDWVLAKQYDQTRKGLLESDQGIDVDWQWVVASRSTPATAAPATVVDVRVEATTEPARGEPGDRFLTVDVEAYVVHRFDEGGERRVVVVRRSVSLSSWDPFGGPDYPPWLGMGAGTYGADFCPLARSAVITPTTGDRELVAGAAELRRMMGAEGVDPSDDADQRNRRYAEKARACATVVPPGGRGATEGA